MYNKILRNKKSVVLKMENCYYQFVRLFLRSQLFLDFMTNLT